VWIVSASLSKLRCLRPVSHRDLVIECSPYSSASCVAADLLAPSLPTASLDVAMVVAGLAVMVEAHVGLKLSISVSSLIS